MDYYRVLEITEQAGEEQIKQAYRKLAKKYHPDLNPDNPKAEEKFKNIAKAYEILGDTIKRKAYDSTRRQPAIYGNPMRSKPKGSKSEYNKDKSSQDAHSKTEHTEDEHIKIKYSKSEPDKTSQGRVNPEPGKASQDKASQEPGKSRQDKASLEPGRSSQDKANPKPDRTGNDKANSRPSTPKPDMHQSNSTGAIDLEKYFGFSFEEGKKVIKEQRSQKESQQEQDDSLDLAEVFKMFMKMK